MTDTSDKAQASRESLDFIQDTKLRKWVERHYLKQHPPTGENPFHSPGSFVEYVLLQKATEYIPLCNSEDEERAEWERFHQQREQERQKEGELDELRRIWSESESPRSSR